MSLYSEYLKEIEVRKKELGLHPKNQSIAQNCCLKSLPRSKIPAMQSAKPLNFFIYNTLPGTTPAAGVKAKFLKDIVTGAETVAEISRPSL